MRMPNLEYIQGEYRDRLYETLRHQSPKMGLTALPFDSNSFDAIICQHVLEHIQPDRKVMKELFRVLRPGGWAVISSPIRWDQETYEDPTIIDPEERQRAFGERIHVRIYGHDLKDRLEEAGFIVQVDFGENVEKTTREKYGLRDDEDLFYCLKNKKEKR